MMSGVRALEAVYSRGVGAVRVVGGEGDGSRFAAALGSAYGSASLCRERAPGTAGSAPRRGREARSPSRRDSPLPER